MGLACQEGSSSFLKKEPKNFYTLGRALRLALQPKLKSFLLLFFKKEDLAFLSELPRAVETRGRRLRKAGRKSSAD
jgi:hypothetical protein